MRNGGGMNIRIGFIVSSPFASYLECLRSELASFCEILYLVAEDNEKASSLYTQNLGRVDCFICSGQLLYYAVKTRVPRLEKPIYILDDQRADIKAVFLQLLIENRGFDLSRVYVDFACEQNDWLGIKDWLPRDQWPYFARIEVTEITRFDEVEEICRAIGRRHYELRRAGLIDLSLTRVGLLARVFERDGLPFRYVYPSRDYVVNFFLQIINAHESAKAEGAFLGAISIIVERAAIERVEEALAAYFRRRNYDFTLQKEDDRIVVLTRKRDLEDLTGGFSSCDLEDRLEASSGAKVAVGLGAGNNFFQARIHAMRAAELSRARSGAVFFASEAGDLVGPLASGPTAGRSSSALSSALSSEPSHEVLARSRRLHVDHLSLQKIVAYVSMSGSTRVRADELAEYLGITLRSASRLLGKIEANGGAICYLENSSGGRGRPRKYYDLDLGGMA
jgi:Bacterial regulatory proteins, crp family